MESTRTNVTILGLGIMGGGMSRRLIGAGFKVAAYNRTREKAEALAVMGARVADNPRDAARDADVIISMVADDVASRAGWLGDDGALAGAKRGAIAVECSTVTPDWIRELSEAARNAGLDLLDAPVAGSRAQAAAGELRFFVGGDAATLERVKPVLAVMSKSIDHIGPVGSGALIKLINNFVCAVQVTAIAEGIAMIERSGLNPEALRVLTEGAPGSPLVKLLSARMTGHDYTPNFFLRLMAKDLRYAIAAGAGNSLDLGTARAALVAFERAIEQGHGDRDMAAVVEPMRAR